MSQFFQPGQWQVPPEQSKVDKLKGKTLLVTLTMTGENREVMEKMHFKAVIEDLTDEALVLKKEDGEVVKLPPDIEGMQSCPPGPTLVFTADGKMLSGFDYAIGWSITPREHVTEEDHQDPEAWYI